LDSHRSFFLAGVSGQGGRTRQPCVEPGFTDDDDVCSDGGDSGLDMSALSSLSEGEEARIA
jgi:hypothetical protein